MKITVLVKGDLRHPRSVRAELDKLGRALPQAEVEIVTSPGPGDLVELAAKACDNSDYLVAAGGDGTLNEVLNGCLRQGRSADELPTLGLLPLGTANDFARGLGLQDKSGELTDLLQSGSFRQVDAGRVTYMQANGETAQRFFLNSADIGIGAEVIRYMQAHPWLPGRNLRYLAAIFRTFLSFRHKSLRVQTDRGLDWQGKSLALVAANGRYFGSGLCIAPQAQLDDGALSLTLVGDASTVDFLRNLGVLKRGELLQHPAASYHRALRLEVHHDGTAAAVEADGELLGTTPATVEILPAALKIISPPAPVKA